MFAFLAGWRLYVALALVVAFSVLGGYAALEHQRRLTSDARIETVKHERDDLANKLVQAEADKQDLIKKQAELDAAVVERDRRMKELENAKRQISIELDKLRATLPKEDQACLTRPLPPALVAFLRDDGPDSNDKGNEAASPGKPAAPLLQNPAGSADLPRGS